MNNRDLKLYSYLKSKGGGPTPPSPDVKWPQVVDADTGCRGMTLNDPYYSKNFNLKTGDIVLVCVSYEGELSLTSGAVGVAANNNGNRYLKMFTYTCEADETKKFMARQSVYTKFGVTWIQLRNCNIYETTDMNATSSITLPKRPFIYVVGSSASNSTALGLEKLGTEGLRSITGMPPTAYSCIMVYLNFNTFYQEVGSYDGFQIVGPGSLVTTGVYLTDE